MRLKLFSLLLSILFVAGCSGSETTSAGGGAPAPPPPSQTSTLLVRLDFSDQPLDPEIVSFRIRVTDEEGFTDLVPEVVQPRDAEGIAQEISLGEVPIGLITVVVEGLNAEGTPAASFVQNVELTAAPQTVTITRLIAKGQTREIGLVSVGANGVASDGPSSLPVLSLDGRFVAFVCGARSLTNSTNDEIMVRDRQSGTLSRVSIRDEAGGRLFGDKTEPDISSSGQFVSFRLGKAQGKIYRRNRQASVTAPSALVTGGQVLGQDILAGSRARISGDGSKVVFQTLVNGVSQVVLRNFDNNTLELISLSTAGGFANGNSSRPCISGDGRFVVFASQATNLISGGTSGLYVRDRLGQSTTRLNINPTHVNSNISDDGRFILASAPDRVPFLFDQANGTVTQIPINVGLVGVADLSNDGRFISFFSTRQFLVPNDLNGRADAFIFDRQTGFISRVNVSNDGTAVAGGVDTSEQSTPALSGDGKRVAFASADSLLVPNNSNQNLDIYSASVPTVGRMYAGVLALTLSDLGCFEPRTGQSLALLTSTSATSVPFRTVFLDVTNDRLYAVKPGLNPGSLDSIIVINSVSTKGGSGSAPIVPDRQMHAADIQGILVDVGRNKLYVRHSDEIRVFDNASTLNGTLGQGRTILTSFEPNPLLTAFLLDFRRDELYVAQVLPGGGREIAVFGAASTTSGTPLPVRKLSGANPFLGLTGQIVGLLFDPSPPSAGGTANDAALVVLDTDGKVATFASNGSRTGVLGDVPADTIVARSRSAGSGALLDPTSNLQYVPDPQGAFFTLWRTGSSQTAPEAIVQPLLTFLAGLALDRTR